jgi:hypothetical protein
MKFTEYTVVESTGNSIDPLGFLRPSSALADGLFRQFTILSNNPSYHGFLCFVFHYLEEKGILPGSSGFSKKFRDLESFWGVLNANADTSILNITKYIDIAKKKDVTLSDVKKYALLYARLNYGALGHYSSPSIFWALLNPKGTQLTDRGYQLGEAWRIRGGTDFKELLDKWANGKGYDEIVAGNKAQALFNLAAKPSSAEKSAWQDIIRDYCIRWPVIRPLWEKPIPEKILGLAEEGKSYPGLFAGIIEHYRDYPELLKRIELVRRFEVLAGYTQFVFEWEYVKRLDEVKLNISPAPQIEDHVQNIFPRLATEYHALSGKDANQLFKNIACAMNYSSISDVIIQHHTAHQKSKGTSAFLAGDDVIVKDRVDKNSFLGLLELLKSQKAGIQNAITWQYRRNWHFGRSAIWQEYAGGWR